MVILIIQARKSLFFRSIFDKALHLFFLQKSKLRKIAEFLKIVDQTDKALESKESGILHHTFDQDPYHPFRSRCSEVYENDEALLSNLANKAVGIYFEVHAEIGTDFYVEFYKTVGDKFIEAMSSPEVISEILTTKLVNRTVY